MRWLWSVLALSASHTLSQCGRGLSSFTHMQLTLSKKMYFWSIFREVLYIVYLLSLSLLEKYGSDNPRLAVNLAYWNVKPELTRELLLARVIHPLHTEASLYLRNYSAKHEKIMMVLQNYWLTSNLSRAITEITEVRIHMKCLERGIHEHSQLNKI